MPPNDLIVGKRYTAMNIEHGIAFQWIYLGKVKGSKTMIKIRHLGRDKDIACKETSLADLELIPYEDIGKKWNGINYLLLNEN